MTNSIQSQFDHIFTPEVQKKIIDTTMAYLGGCLQQRVVFYQYPESKKIQPLSSNDIASLLYDPENTPILQKNIFVKGKNTPVSLRELATRKASDLSHSYLKQSGVHLSLAEQKKMNRRIHGIGSTITSTLNFTLQNGFLLDNLRNNPRYQNARAFKRYAEVIDSIPADVTALFPEARALQRHFILHIGDTNTGKTYDAITDMIGAESGAYAAPLRLLALETQERVLRENVPCSMLTGEESDLRKDAKHISSTVELFNTDTLYDVVVIDEAQMIEDEQRGWAWTRVILGAKSTRIHVCMSENAKNILIRLIEKCEDTYEIIEHHRKTSLEYMELDKAFPYFIEPHDALILFSRRDVLLTAAQLKEEGIDASVIYGALPYDVRKREVEKFLNGETSVVVATDAIGMGMNLPIERIIFMKADKFNGKTTLPLTTPQVKQIAGRAGRMGMYKTGYVCAYENPDHILKMLFTPYVQIERARLQLPEKLLDIQMPLTRIIDTWLMAADDSLYEKTNMEETLKKVRFLESIGGLDNRQIWRYATIPFDEGNKTLEDEWKSLAYVYRNEEDMLDALPDIDDIPTSLDALETQYKRLDLYHALLRCCMTMENKERYEKALYGIRKQKVLLSDHINMLLTNIQKAAARKCPRCGREMPATYQYRLCEKCFSYGIFSHSSRKRMGKRR